MINRRPSRRIAEVLTQAEPCCSICELPSCPFRPQKDKKIVLFCKEGLVDIVDDNINGNVVDIIDLHDSSAVVVERGEMSSAATGDGGEDGRVLVIKVFLFSQN